MALALFFIGISFFILLYFFFKNPQFGKAPSGERLERIKQSPNYRNGQFQNLEHTPNFTEGYSVPGIFYDMFFKKHLHTRPKKPILSQKNDLHNLPKDKDIFVWFGHSSYFLQISGYRFLIDPVFSGNASPLPRSNTSFEGSDIYSAEDIPEIDYLLITHDHYDHLDYPTIKSLKDKIKMIVCGLGVGEHFEKWGFDSQKIIEKDWYESLEPQKNLKIHTAPTRHFSGRFLNRNNTLWLSFILQIDNKQIYLGGDSGYGIHFTEIGKRFKHFDLAILENGQYNKAWHAIHLFPEEAVKAAKELNASRIIPVHSSKFKLSNHPWYAPLEELTKYAQKENIPVLHPQIGQIVDLENKELSLEQWWRIPE